jgi:hypothetical protein
VGDGGAGVVEQENTMKVGDSVAWLRKNSNYYWEYDWVRVVSVGDGVVSVYRSLSRNELLDGEDSIIFADPEDLLIDDGKGSVSHEVERRNK